MPLSAYIFPMQGVGGGGWGRRFNKLISKASWLVLFRFVLMVMLSDQDGC